MELAKATWHEARAHFAKDPIAFQPIGSTEPHGPHLPLDTDVTIALAQARRAAEKIEARGVPTVILPPLAYGLTRFTDGFEGTISLRPGTLWALLEDVVESISDQGLRYLVLSNGHLEPEHVEVLRGVAIDFAEPTRTTAQVLFPDNTRRRWAKTLGEEFASGDCHAGRYESSIILAADPDGVREDARKALPAHAIDLIGKIRGGARSFLEAGADKAYCGDPAAASSDEGEGLIERLAEMIATSVEETWPGRFE